MANPLLDRALPAELADRSQHVEYKGVIGDFERLRDIAEQDFERLATEQRPRDWRQKPVEVELEFFWLDANRVLPAAKGRIRAIVPAVCQRCLETFELALDAPVRVLFGNDQVEAPQGDDYDAWESDDESVRLQDIVEESLVMALPLAPTHRRQADCGALAGKIPGHEAPETTRPFAGLRAQMDELDK